MEPGPDRGSAETRVGDVEGRDGHQLIVDRFESRSEVMAADIGQRRRPEAVEVGRLCELGGVRAKQVSWQVRLRQGRAPSRQWLRLVTRSSRLTPKGSRVAPPTTRCEGSGPGGPLPSR